MALVELPDDEEAAPWKQLLPGKHFLVFYRDDDVWHERLALWPMPSRAEWAVRTPDGDQYLEKLDGGDDGPEEIRVLPSSRRLPQGLGAQTYRFRARLDLEMLKNAIRGGMALVSEECAERGEAIVRPESVEMPDGEVVPLEDAYGGAFVQRRMRGKGPADGSAPLSAPLDLPMPPRPSSRPIPPAMPPPLRVARGTLFHLEPPADASAEGPPVTWGGGPVPFGCVWLAAEPTVADEMGAEIMLSANDVIVDKAAALVLRGGAWFRAELVRLEEAPGYADRRRAALGIHVRAARDLDSASRHAETEIHGAPAVEQGEDARTLWIDVDEQGARFKEWRRVCQEIFEQQLPEGSVDGPPSTVFLCRRMLGHSGDPQQWLPIWAKLKGLNMNDRAYHEMTTLTDIVFFGGCVDQLNLGGLASFECACRRIQTIMDAYANPSKASPIGRLLAFSVAAVVRMMA